MKLSDQQKYEAIRNLAKTDLFFLLVYVLNRKDAFNQFVLDRCREYETAPWGYLDLWAREHFKSTIITFAHTIQEIINDPEGSNCIFSHTRKIATSFLVQIKREFETNEKLKGLFPEIFYQTPENEAPLWSKYEGIIVKRKGNPKEATLEAWGVVDGQPIGRHFGCMKYDDLVTPETVNTAEQIEKCLYLFRMSLNLGSSDVKMGMIGTFYAHNDPYTSLIEARTVIPRIYPAMRIKNDFSSGVLMPELLLRQKMRDMGRDVFSTQMMLDPSLASGKAFEVSWLKYYAHADRHDMNVYILVDPAGSKNKKSDYSVFMVAGLNRDGNIYVLDFIRDKMSLTERTNTLFRLKEEYDGKVYYEEYGLQADVEHIGEEQERRNFRFVINKIGGSLNKKARILRLQPKFQNGEIYFPPRLMYTTVGGQIRDLVEDFIAQEYRNFPAVDHDDMLDCLSRIFDTDMMFPNSSSRYRVESYQ